MNYSYKQIWHIVYPLLISLFMEHLIGLTDTAFLGRVGEIQLGASALGGVYYISIFIHLRENKTIFYQFRPIQVV